MSGAAPKLADCVQAISNFKGNSLSSRISELEFTFANSKKAEIETKLTLNGISCNLFDAARTVKLAAAQIDVAIHAIGILVLLPKVLEADEIVENLSLGAGTTEERRFDVETDRRVAEFTFIDWQGNDNTRLQKVFKDFYRIAEFKTSKRKELWLSDDAYALKYLRSGTSVRSATHKHRDVWEDFQRKYPELQRVSDYYRLNMGKVSLRVFGRELQ